MMTPDPLFVACTRPTLKLGVPLEGFVANAALTIAVTVFIIGKPPGFLIGVLVHYALRELVRADPHFFRKWTLFFQTKMRSRTGAIWGGSRLDPSPTRIRRAAQVPSCL